MTVFRRGIIAIALLVLGACGPQQEDEQLRVARERPGYSDRYGTPLSGGTPTIPRSGCEVECAPNFEVTTFEGSRFELTSRLGKVVVLNFWESW